MSQVNNMKAYKNKRIDREDVNMKSYEWHEYKNLCVS